MIKTHNRRELDMTYMGGGFAISTSAPVVEKKPDAVTTFFENMVSSFLPKKNGYTDASERLDAFLAYVNEKCGPAPL